LWLCFGVLQSIQNIRVVGLVAGSGVQKKNAKDAKEDAKVRKERRGLGVKLRNPGGWDFYLLVLFYRIGDSDHAKFLLV
jgi:hypothetical protein